jgi:fumarate reductase flavoprotein subunit
MQAVTDCDVVVVGGGGAGLAAAAEAAALGLQVVLLEKNPQLGKRRVVV